LLAAFTGAARAQKAPLAASPSASVAGVVQTPGAKAGIPMPGLMVTVHRVGSDSSGPMDSARTDARGRYAIRYSRFGDDRAVYFAAAVYRGIAYFSAPLQGLHTAGDEAEITVFDTTSKKVEFHVQGHHVVISAPHPDGNRDVIEVWELSNDTTVTVVGRDSLVPVWAARLPAGAARFTGGPGDVAASALSLRGDSAVLLAAFGPGVKQLSYTYSLPSSSFPLSIVMTKPTSVLEVLVEEAGGQVTGASLKSMAVATTQGRTFKRWLGQDVEAGQSVVVTVPTTSAALRTRMLLALAGVILAAMGFALVRAFRARGRRGTALPSAEQRHGELVASIATLDARMERGDGSLTGEEYATKRAQLKAQLAATLAEESRGV
jgi:hypothetical protein